MINIVFCIGNLSKPGGTERVLINIVNALAKNKGYHIYVITEHQGDVSPYYPISDTVKIIDLKINDIQSFVFKIPVIGFFYKINVVKKKYKAAISTLIPHIIINFERGFADFSIPDLDVVSIRGLHSSLKAVRLMDRAGNVNFKKRFFTYLYNRQLTKYDEVVFLTKCDMDARKLKNGRTIIPNYIPKFDLAPNYSTESKKIISIGRLDKFKNFEDQIRMFETVVKIHNDWSLYIYGEGRERENLMNLIGELNLQNHVYLMGNTQQVERVLQESAFFIFTSIAEGFGIVQIEAMQMGLPVISYNCDCGPSEIITDTVDGFLIDAGNTDQFLDKMLLLMNDPQLRKKMSDRAIEKSKNYSEDKIIHQWHSLFNQKIKDVPKG